MLNVRTAKVSDFRLIREFYNQNKSKTYQINESDIFILAWQNSEIIGAVRLADEFGVKVLRGMQVSATHQRQGVGTALLKEFLNCLGKSECYCLPYTHLEKFYSQIGFVKAETENSPEFLQIRLKEYLKTINVILIYRHPTGTTMDFQKESR